MKEVSVGNFHEHCFACGERSENGLKLKFRLLENGSIQGEVSLEKKFQGYDDFLHGGIITTILVSSMVNLFYVKKGNKVTTARLNIRFRKPVPVGKRIVVNAIEQDRKGHFYRARAQVVCDASVLAEAEGYFTKGGDFYA